MAVAGEGPHSVGAAPQFAHPRILAFVYIDFTGADAFLLGGIVDGREWAGTAEAPSCILTAPIHAVGLIQALVYINTLQKIAVIVEALLAVAFITRLRVDTLPFLADFLSKQDTLIYVAVCWDAIVEDGVIQNETFAIRAENMELHRIENRTRVDFTVVPPSGPQ